MKVWIHWEEKYPVPAIETENWYKFTQEAEISDDDYRDWRRVQDEYDAWCEKWEKIFVNEAKKTDE